jgi:hypothetical protein
VVNIAPLPDPLRSDATLLCGCVAGAAPVEQIRNWLAAAGFHQIEVSIRPESRDMIATWAPEHSIEDYVISATIEARKP